MRRLVFAAFCGLAVTTVACEQLADALGSSLGNQEADAGSDAPAPATAADSGVVGGHCGTESQSGLELCAATTMCPTLVVDTQAMPHCGFRIRGAAVDLVCSCGGAVCPIGVFATCAEAAQLLASQTESAVCVQLAEGRCIERTAAPATSSGSTSSSSSSSSSGSPGCDRQCVRDCGGGAACASVCNCS